ncbi:hypothetical protein KI387_010887, partial [Taxus chinensis]
MKQVVDIALQVRYRHLYTPSIYGTEPTLGEALNHAFLTGIINRDEIFVTKSIWRGMEQCMESGLTKSIGVSNLSYKKLGDLLSYANISPAVNQEEMHPLWQQKKLRDYCSNVNIHVSAWSPLGGFGTFYGSNSVMENPVIEEIAKKHGKTVTQHPTLGTKSTSLAMLNNGLHSVNNNTHIHKTWASTVGVFNKGPHSLNNSTHIQKTWASAIPRACLENKPIKSFVGQQHGRVPLGGSANTVVTSQFNALEGSKINTSEVDEDVSVKST